MLELFVDSTVSDFADLLHRSVAPSECEAEIRMMKFGNHEGICVICLDKIVLQETALVKGCKHAYCLTCILRWATYNQKVTCPQCKHPFEFLYAHHSLDGSIHDYMFEESLCLLLRASCFKPLTVEDHAHHEDVYDDIEDYYQYEDVEEDEDLDEDFGGSSSLRIGYVIDQTSRIQEQVHIMNQRRRRLEGLLRRFQGIETGIW